MPFSQLPQTLKLSRTDHGKWSVLYFLCVKRGGKNGASFNFDLDAVEHMTDEEAIAALSSLKGIGVWTAEMILLFCLRRPNILSFDDLAIRRGMASVYHRKDIDRKLFETIRKRLSPCCSVASLYFWAVAGGAMGAKRPLKHKVKREVKK